VLPGTTLAELLQLPYVLISTSVPHNFGWTVPRSLSQCDNPVSHFERVRKHLLQVSVFRMPSESVSCPRAYSNLAGVSRLSSLDTGNQFLLHRAFRG
jgi:hypothetical protein